MTLVELLVVLALLVVIGGIVVPVFTGSFASVRLRRAGDQVLTRWSQARAEAIEAGEVRQFRYTPETGDYRIEPWANLALEQAGSSSAASTTGAVASDAATDADAATSTDATTGADAAGADDVSGADSRTLPERITFYSGRLAVADAATGERQAASMQSSRDEQSTPILFFPDGRTTEASVVLANDRNQFLRLTLRGLTGVGRATEVLSREELDRADR